MKNNYKFFGIIVMGLILISSAMMGCVDNSDQESTSTSTSNSIQTDATTQNQQTNQVLTVGAQKDFKSAVEGRSLVFETLTTVDKYGNPLPKLVESWDMSQDGKIYTFYLRKGVVFHDDTPFDAKAAKFALDLSMEKASYKDYMDSMEIVDDHTLKIIFNNYYDTFLLDIASEFKCCVASPLAVEPEWDPNGKIVEYIGTGPFKLVDYSKDQEAVLVRNDDYWDNVPKLDKVIWKTVPDPYTQIIALKAGELDIIGVGEHHSSIPYIEITKLEEDPNIDVMVESFGRYQVIEFNCKKEPFNDKRIRSAFNYGIDRELMVQTLFADVTEPSYVITAPWFKWGPANIKEGYTYDPERAKQLLAEAGWEDNDGDGILDKNGKPFICELVVPYGEANADVVSVFLQSELKELGVEMDILTLESGAAGDKKSAGEYDMYVHHSGCLPSIPGGASPGGKYYSKNTNWAWEYAYHSNELDELIESAFSTPDEVLQREKLDKVWLLLQDEAPCIPLYDIVKPVAFRNKVHGFTFPATMFETNLHDIEIRETPESGAKSSTMAEQVLTIGAMTDFKSACEGRNIIFEKLVNLDKYGNIVPELAESWEISENGMNYTFHLREGVRFHDGTIFNATTAKFSLEWLKNSVTWGKYSGDIKVIDDYTVILHLNEYYYPLLTDLGYEGKGKIISPAAVEPHWDINGKLENYIGTGAFKLSDYKKDQEAVLVQNDDYWGEKPKLEKVIWKVIPDPYTQIIALKADEIDIIGASEHHSSVPYIEVPELQKNSELEITTQSYGRFQVIRFNCAKEPFTDSKVREAINYAIDRKLMVRTLFADVTEPANLVMAPWFKYGASNITEGYSYDIDRSKALLTEAGWTDSDGDGILDKNGVSLTFDLTIPSGEANADVVAVFVQSELKNIGIEMNLLTIESSTAWDNKKKGEYEAFVHHTGCIPFSPHGLLQQEHLSSISDYKQYYTEELDGLIENAFTTRDDTERKEYYDRIWNILQEESVCVPLYDITKLVVYRNNVKGFVHPATMYEIDLMNIEII